MSLTDKWVGVLVSVIYCVKLFQITDKMAFLESTLSALFPSSLFRISPGLDTFSSFGEP